MEVHVKYSSLKPTINDVTKHLRWITHSYLPDLSFFACPVTDNTLKESLVKNKHSWQWPYLWTSGVVMARWILDNPSIVKNKTVYDLGTGQGAVAIAAKVAGAKRVVGIDCCAYSEFVLEQNSLKNKVTTYFLNRDILINTIIPDGSVVFASDVIYGQQTSNRLLKKFLELSDTNSMFVAQTMRTNPSYTYPVENASTLMDVLAPVEFDIELDKNIQCKIMQLQKT